MDMNKPVAWAIKSDGDFTEIGFDDDDLQNIELWYAEQGWSYEYVPLYTHPVKEQEVRWDMSKITPYTDKSILKLWQSIPHPDKLQKFVNTIIEKSPVLESHPVKELTDGEITETITAWFGNSQYDFFDGQLMDFAKSILRKAQEK